MHDSTITRKNTKDKIVLLYLRKRYFAGSSKKHFVCSTRRKVPQSKWNPITGRVRVKGYAKGVIDNAHLNKLKKHIDNFAEEFFLSNSRYPTKIELKESVNNFFGSKKKEEVVEEKKEVTIFDLIEKLIEDTFTDPNLSDDSAKVYTRLRFQLRNYEKAGNVVSFKAITTEWLQSFQSWLTVQSPSNNAGKRLEPTYVRKIIKTLKYVMRKGLKGFHNNKEFEEFRIKVKSSTKVRSYCIISEEDLYKLYRFNFKAYEVTYKQSLQERLDSETNKSKRHGLKVLIGKHYAPLWELYRDNILRGCFTGVRFQDLKHVVLDNTIKEIVDDKEYLFFNYKSKKTRVFSSLPVHPILKEVLQRPYVDLTKHPSSFNKMARQVLSHAGIPNANIFSSHDMRRTCNIWLKINGATPEERAKMIGWKDDKMPKIYDKLSAIQQAKLFIEKLNL